MCRENVLLSIKPDRTDFRVDIRIAISIWVYDASCKTSASNLEYLYRNKHCRCCKQKQHFAWESPQATWRVKGKHRRMYDWFLFSYCVENNNSTRFVGWAQLKKTRSTSPFLSPRTLWQTALLLVLNFSPTFFSLFSSRGRLGDCIRGNSLDVKSRMETGKKSSETSFVRIQSGRMKKTLPWKFRFPRCWNFVL